MRKSLFLVFFSAFILQGLHGQLTLVQDENVYYESPIYKDGAGKKYSDLITIKFKEKIIDRSVGTKEIDKEWVKGNAKKIFNELKNTFGPFSIKKAYPNKVWGDNYRIHKRTKKRIKVRDFSQVYIIRFNKPVELTGVIGSLVNHDIVEHVAPPMEFTLTQTMVNDPEVVNGNQWKLGIMDAFNAWDVSKGSSDITIVISDLFRNYSNYQNYHEDIIDRDITNYVGGKYGYHGGVVAGQAAATTNNNLGIAGMDWNAKLVFAGMSTNMFYDAVDDWDADIINCSWIASDNVFLSAAVEYALQNGVIITAGSGNNQSNIGRFRPIPSIVYPAAYNFGDNLQVLAVTAYGFNGNVFFPPDPYNPTGYWNYSPGTDPIGNPTEAFVDFCAPGYDIRMFSYYDRDEYWFGRGTSFSSPTIAGVIGLMLAIDEDLAPDEIYSILRNTSDKIGEFEYDSNGWNQYYGWGGVNAYRAVSAVEPPDTPSGISVVNYSGKPKLTWNKSIAKDVVSYRLERRIDGGSWTVPSGAYDLGPDDTEFVDFEIRIFGINPSRTAEYRICSNDFAGLNSNWSGIVRINFTIDLKNDLFETELVALPANFELLDNYPNPFNPTTAIKFGLPETGKVKIIVYNSKGQEVRVLANQSYNAGYHEVTFDASDLPSGIYFYRMNAGDYTAVRKMLLVK
jgi:hypothetical protein